MNEPAPQPGWTGEDHQEFYQRIKSLGPAECSRALIEQSQKLLALAKGSDHDLLKAAESMMGYWLMQVGHEEDRFQANQLLARIYTELGEPEKAKGFR